MVWVVVECLMDQLRQRFIQLGTLNLEWHRGFGSHGSEFLQRCSRALATVRSMAGEQFVERCGQAIDIGSSVNIVAVLELFRGHVVERAHQLADRGELVGYTVHAVQQS